MGWWKHAQQNFEAWPDAALTGALLAAALLIVLIALTPGQRLFKAIALAYIILP